MDEESPLLDRITPVKEIEKSVEHIAKDFQLIHVPQRDKAVSKTLKHSANDFLLSKIADF